MLTVNKGQKVIIHLNSGNYSCIAKSTKYKKTLARCVPDLNSDNPLPWDYHWVFAEKLTIVN